MTVSNWNKGSGMSTPLLLAECGPPNLFARLRALWRRVPFCLNRCAVPRNVTLHGPAGLSHRLAAENHLGRTHRAEHGGDRRDRCRADLADFASAWFSSANPYPLCHRGCDRLPARPDCLEDRFLGNFATACSSGRVYCFFPGTRGCARLDHPGGLGTDGARCPKGSRLSRADHRERQPLQCLGARSREKIWRPGNAADSRKDRDPANTCLLYTSDAADERSSVDLGGRRIIKKKKC